jgi:hypothetical protein
MLNTIASTSKWIVIASASRTNHSTSHNMTRTASAFGKLANLKVKALGLVTGFYREEGQEMGQHEQSMVFGVTRTGTLKAVIDMFCGQFKQDCILVWNTDSNQVWLVNREDGMFMRLGCKGMRILTETESLEEHNAYTIDTDSNIWVVA